MDKSTGQKRVKPPFCVPHLIFHFVGSYTPGLYKWNLPPGVRKRRLKGAFWAELLVSRAKRADTNGISGVFFFFFFFWIYVTYF